MCSGTQVKRSFFSTLAKSKILTQNFRRERPVPNFHFLFSKWKSALNLLVQHAVYRRFLRATHRDCGRPNNDECFIHAVSAHGNFGTKSIGDLTGTPVATGGDRAARGFRRAWKDCAHLRCPHAKMCTITKTLGRASPPGSNPPMFPLRRQFIHRHRPPSRCCSRFCGVLSHQASVRPRLGVIHPCPN